MIQNLVSIVNGVPTTTSLQIAEVFGRGHNTVLRDIRDLLEKCPEPFGVYNFVQSEYTNEQNKKMPMYIITRDGMTLLVMGYTGDKAMEYKMAYIEAFNAMEAKLRSSQQSMLPRDYAEALRALANEVEQKELMQRQRDEAIRTKAWIADKKTATAMNTASQLSKENRKLKDELGNGKHWKQVKAIPWLRACFRLTPAAYSQIGKKLTILSVAMGLLPQEVQSSEYGTVKKYHVNVIDRFREMLIEDGAMLGKYRLTV